MPSIKAKPYTITTPAEQGHEIEEMFDDLYRRLGDSVGFTVEEGDLLVGTDENTLDVLSVGTTAGMFLRSDATNPGWSTLILPNAATIGDIPYASAANTLSMLAGVATGNALISGGVATAPSWGKINLNSSTGHVTGTLLATSGGTGFSSYAVGDILAASATTLLTKITDVATGNALISGGVNTLPSWGKIGLTTHISGVLPVANGGTNLSSYTIGDLLYADGATSLAKLADVATGNALISGGIGVAPSWGKIALTTHVSGVLPIANGGTNNSSAYTAGSIVFSNGTILTQDNASLFWDDTNNRLGIGTAVPGAGFHLSQSLVAASGTEYAAKLEYTTNKVAGDDYGLYINHTDTFSPGASYLLWVGSNASARMTIQRGGRTTLTGTGSSPVLEVTNANTVGVFMDLLPTGSGGVNYRIQSTASGAGEGAGVFLIGMTGTGTALALGVGANRNVAIGHTSFPTTGTLGLIFTDGTALATMASNTAGLYADDVGGTVEMFGINEAGNVSQLTGLNIRKTADEGVTNSTTHQADDHLTVNLAASSSYEFDIWGFWTTAGATAGISVQLDGTAGVSSLKADIAIIDNTTNAFSAYARITAFNSAVGAGLTGDNSFFIKGVIEVSTAGTLFLEWAQQNADAVNASTLQENSYFILRRLNA